ncbi:predicted protein [Aspergillus nidulans FGSC A4]|uniref:Uncharacterized protein n=1 Tax=Emericella nidulans (strain FGSC A4 / ATCC 38163 / CBS 112.46 / NRRL 194 / M139) TaxID=227321 RepID=Q5B013_EMENI|nr:hypothetical protein [Aspergillus nidulans FGSC A4]EAA58092.1 predicted protein [Aspergillus nidulans FGSC A4]CBF70151.1 TPA: conserved hypothetical protein [Aspergillus nidulans FGSC A4]|eukprot:XP_663721.1 predicted protein [Aspergillus nidulans FGSC A4]
MGHGGSEEEKCALADHSTVEDALRQVSVLRDKYAPWPNPADTTYHDHTTNLASYQLVQTAVDGQLFMAPLESVADFSRRARLSAWPCEKNCLISKRYNVQQANA